LSVNLRTRLLPGFIYYSASAGRARAQAAGRSEAIEHRASHLHTHPAHSAASGVYICSCTPTTARLCLPARVVLV
ncbi:hypothetical protein BAE44_0015375, partial [Dichanthelium oligosanthes]